ncbi:MAG: polysaccharide biosynthesis/export family protein [Candidatus Omnitrophota bacterium]
MKRNKIILFLCFAMLFFCAVCRAEKIDLKVVEPADDEAAPAIEKASAPLPDNIYTDPTRYTLGPDDVVEIVVMRHSEFSGIFPVNLEGKIQFKFVGDIEVTGLTKKELEEKIRKTLSTYIVNPDVNVTILEFRSKVIYVLGEVGAPGKYYMRSESIPVREAVVQAGLPTLSAAMRRCRLITPTDKGRPKIKDVDLYSLLYGGDLKKNIDMHPGDVLYVPATVMAKVVRVINPVTSAVGVASSGPEGVNSGRTAGQAMVKP